MRSSLLFVSSVQSRALEAPKKPLLDDFAFAALPDESASQTPFRTPGSMRSFRSQSTIQGQSTLKGSAHQTPRRSPSIQSVAEHSTRSCSEADSEESQARQVLSRYLDYTRTSAAEGAGQVASMSELTVSVLGGFGRT